MSAAARKEADAARAALLRATVAAPGEADLGAVADRVGRAVAAAEPAGERAASCRALRGRAARRALLAERADPLERGPGLGRPARRVLRARAGRLARLDLRDAAARRPDPAGLRGRRHRPLAAPPARRPHSALGRRLAGPRRLHRADCPLGAHQRPRGTARGRAPRDPRRLAPRRPRVRGSRPGGGRAARSRPRGRRERCPARGRAPRRRLPAARPARRAGGPDPGGGPAPGHGGGDPRDRQSHPAVPRRDRGREPDARARRAARHQPLRRAARSSPARAVCSAPSHLPAFADGRGDASTAPPSAPLARDAVRFLDDVRRGGRRSPTASATRRAGAPGRSGSA